MNELKEILTVLKDIRDDFRKHYEWVKTKKAEEEKAQSELVAAFETERRKY